MAATRVTTQDIKDAAVTGAKLSVLSAKGDIAVFGTAHTRLPVGADGAVLVADSAEATGLKWAAGGLAATNFVVSETPAGSIDGSNAAFTLTDPPVAGTLQLFKNGIRQNPGATNDYTIATNTITFLAGNIPQTGDVLLCDYRK